MFGTGASDEICSVKLKQARGGGWYCDVGHHSTKIYDSARAAIEAGNAYGEYVYGSTIRKVDLTQIRG